ncbi:MAG: glucans biosynthesis glucosyltransferase MdoH [Geminicoccaceae bacterium]|nr:glucans biosynthesis glucosyltransferase MdoH [Geminicoccaceae bacterium]MCX7629315.1 glucans biosynthesis glucosyltransferase MdoH [Geminicoccaceae bacterium]MDW8125690.1 glucans biosynthesis glucosyltransferase MdoH [Geminicoccaceae bacterium]
MSSATSDQLGSLEARWAERWRVALERTSAYLEAAGLERAEAEATAAELIAPLAAQQRPESEAEAVRLALEEAQRALARAPVVTGEERLAPSSAPGAIRRQSLAPALRWRRGRWLPRPVLIPRETREGASRTARGRFVPPAIDPVARRRRATFFVLIVATTVWGTWTLAQILGVNGLSAVDLAHLGVFSLLMLWLAQSFWTLAAGFVVLLLRWLRRRPQPMALPDPSDAAGRVAIVMPIYNEDTERVFNGLLAMWQDLRRTAPEDRRCDLFVLSDTTDPDIWLAEIEAWRRLRQLVGDTDRIFYRRRDRNVGRKTGNIEDFLTRFGANYAYMVVLDADSLMTGASILELIRRMDENPRVGLIQAPPKLVRGKTLFARILQTAGELYGPLSATGLAYWARGEGNYWGHNAIIRIRPFMELCGLPALPGRAPLGGPILSHDFVEAALMRRGGWQVWIADDLGGSYEEPPPTVEDFAVRDRRWCQGNLQHARVLVARHLHWVSRLHLAIGIMSYITSPLWALFLLLSALQAWELTQREPIYFAEGWPFPILPVSVANEALLLLAVTLGLLFVPKLLGLLLALLDGPRRRALGGGARLIASALIETLYSALLAPVMMVLHSWFVLSILSGVSIEWKPQRRRAGASALATAVRTFFWPTAIGAGAAIAAWIATPLLFWWLLPVTAGLVLAVPLALLGASERLGEAAARARLLLVREDSEPPTVMWELDHRRFVAEHEPPLARFVRTVMEPQAHALHLRLVRAFSTRPPIPPKERRLLERKAVHLGPEHLEAAERRSILEDPELLERLHLEAWVHWPEEQPELLAFLRRDRARAGAEPSRPPEEPGRGVGVAA